VDEQVVLDAALLRARGLDERQQRVPQIILPAGFRLHFRDYGKHLSHTDTIIAQ
jgi:hypothetical protein